MSVFVRCSFGENRINLYYSVKRKMVGNPTQVPEMKMKLEALISIHGC
jgi:hypothetical protein